MRVILKQIIVCLTMACMLSSFNRPVSKPHNVEGVSNITVSQHENNVFVSVKTPKNTKIQLFVFDVTGALIKQYDINGPTAFFIKDIEKGIYLYDFLLRDEHIKIGKFELK